MPKPTSSEELMQNVTIGILAGSGWILALRTWTKPSFVRKKTPKTGEWVAAHSPVFGLPHSLHNSR